MVMLGNGVRVTDVSNLACLGAQVDTPTGLSMQLIVMRGIDTVRISYRPAGATHWTPLARVESPERFGQTPTDAKTMLAFALAFAQSGPDE